MILSSVFHCFQFSFHPNQPKPMTQPSIAGVSLKFLPTVELFSKHFEISVIGWLVGWLVDWLVEVNLNLPLLFSSSSWSCSCSAWSLLLLVLLPLMVTDLQQYWWDRRLVWWTDTARLMVMLSLGLSQCHQMQWSSRGFGWDPGAIRRALTCWAQLMPKSVVCALRDTPYNTMGWMWNHSCWCPILIFVHKNLLQQITTFTVIWNEMPILI